MTEFYFDIEATGTDPMKEKIISIQFQPLFYGRPTGKFYILTEKEYGSEENLLKAFREDFVSIIRPEYKMRWTFKKTKKAFIPVGDNLLFDLAVLGVRSYEYNKKWGFWPNDFFNLRYVDLKPILMLMNEKKGGDMFRGYSRFLNWNMKYKNYQIPAFYEQGNWPAIIEYVTEEKERFCEFYSIIKKEMPLLRKKILPSISWAGLPLGLAIILSKIMVAEIKIYCTRIEVVGSIRRKAPFVNDIDILAISEEREEIIGAIERMNGFEGMSRKGEEILSFGYKGTKINIFFATERNWAFWKVIRTGSADFNKMLYSEAKVQGINLAKLEVEEEEDIFKELGMKYVEPERRD